MKARLFVALWLPGVVVGQVASALAPLRARCGELRWQSPDRWHITLAFLGDRDLDREVSRFRSLEVMSAQPVSVRGSGHFGPVLWLGIATTPWLTELATHVQRSMHADPRRFRGHVTIARSRTHAGDRQLAAAVVDLADFASDPWSPHEITLVRSTTGPRPSYEVIASCPLTRVGS